MYFQAGRSSKVFAVAFLFVLPAASVWFVSDWMGEESGTIRYYTETKDQTLDSFQEHGWGALYGTYDQSGFFGEGLGTATPGSHNLDVERPRTWQESAPSRVMVELGVPGLIGFIGVMCSIVLALWKMCRKLLREKTPLTGYAVGLVAFFIANVGSLSISGQILADPFIASFLGLLVGIALSLGNPRFSAARAVRFSALPAAPGFGEPERDGAYAGRP
jgi:O-antigen ligase